MAPNHFKEQAICFCPNTCMTETEWKSHFQTKDYGSNNYKKIQSIIILLPTLKMKAMHINSMVAIVFIHTVTQEQNQRDTHWSEKKSKIAHRLLARADDAPIYCSLQINPIMQSLFPYHRLKFISQLLFLRKTDKRWGKNLYISWFCYIRSMHELVKHLLLFICFTFTFLVCT